MLIEGFYKIIAQENSEGEFKTRVLFNKDHEIYKAHFPGNPITPGVCIVQVLKDLVCRKFDKGFIFSPVANIKFLNVVNPEQTPEVDFNVKYSLVEEKVKVNVTVTDSEKTYTKISGFFKPL